MYQSQRSCWGGGGAGTLPHQNVFYSRQGQFVINMLLAYFK